MNVGWLRPPVVVVDVDVDVDIVCVFWGVLYNTWYMSTTAINVVVEVVLLSFCF